MNYTLDTLGRIITKQTTDNNNALITTEKIEIGINEYGVYSSTSKLTNWKNSPSGETWATLTSIVDGFSREIKKPKA